MGRVMLKAAATYGATRAVLPAASRAVGGAGRAPGGPALRRTGLAAPRPAHAAALHPEAMVLARMLPWCERITSAPTMAHFRAVADLEPRMFSARVRGVDVREIDGGREYRPRGGGDATLLFFHGGGWSLRSVRSHDPACRLIAHLAGVRILSVEYRLAPEHVYPAAADDCFAHYRRHRPDAVGGDSVGGNLAASVLHTARDRDVPLPRFQWLLYPLMNAAYEHPSMATFADGFSLSRDAVRGAIDAYMPDDAVRDDRRASPMLGDMSGLPPAYVATALADPLRDEGEAYAARLHTAGVPVRLDRFPLIHGFVNFTATPSAMAATRVAAAALRDGLR